MESRACRRIQLDEAAPVIDRDRAMETAIIWPARCLGHVPQLLGTVQAVGIARSRDRDIAHAARKLGLPGRLARRWNRGGLDLIAAGLRRDAVAVF